MGQPHPRNPVWNKIYAELRQEPYQAEAVRLTTIQILGAIAFLNGILIAFTIPEIGGSLLWFDRVWGWPMILGLVLATSGATQLYSVLASRPVVAAIACYGCSLWYALFSAGFAIQFVSWAIGAEDLYNGLRPNVYPVAVYLGLSALHLAQAGTIRQKSRASTTIERLAANDPGTLSDG